MLIIIERNSERSKTMEKETRQEKFQRLFALSASAKEHPLIAKLLFEMADKKNRYNAYSEILPLCWQSKDKDEIAEVMMLLILFEPENTNSALLHTVSPFIDDYKWVEKHGITGEFALGSVMGIFMAGNWLLHRWVSTQERKTDFFCKLPKHLARIIAADNPLVRELPAIDKHYESKLSSLVKQLVAIPGDGPFQIVSSTAKRFVFNLAEELNQILKMRYSPLGALLIEHIFIKHFISRENWEKINFFAVCAKKNYAVKTEL